MSSEVLIYGYCRDIQSLLTSFSNEIPDDVIDLCLKFYELATIINIAMGQCGNRLTHEFFKSMFKEYNLNNKDTAAAANKTAVTNSSIGNTYLRKHQDLDYFIPRCISIDLTPNNDDFAAIKSINMSPVDSCFHGEAAYCNCMNWAKGFYSDGTKLIDDAMNGLRKEIEQYEAPQAIQFMHSIASGTGTVITIHRHCSHCKVLFIQKQN